MIPLNGDVLAALARLLERARALGSSEPERYVFSRLRGADHRSLTPAEKLAHGVAQTGSRNRQAHRQGRQHNRSSVPVALSAAPSQLGNAPPAPIRGMRFHDLRHQAITEMAEAGASDATLMAVAGRMSRRMLEHYSHVRMAAKRTALEQLESDLMGGPSATCQPESRKPK